MPHQDQNPSSRMLLAVVTGSIALSLVACVQNSQVDSVARNSGSPIHHVSAVVKADEHSSESGEKFTDAVTMNNDVALLIRVKSALAGEPELQPFPIDVGVMRGVITLYGSVDTAERYDRAVQLARNVRGVKRVTSGIVVKRNS